jgi:hypothetical protein
MTLAGSFEIALTLALILVAAYPDRRIHCGYVRESQDLPHSDHRPHRTRASA